MRKPDPATIARDNAINCEMRKIGDRQSKDGRVVSFVLHPDEIPAELVNAAVGTRYMVALVELNDDESPKVQQTMGGAAPDNMQTKNEPNEVVQPAVPNAPVRRAHSYAKQAGIFCQDMTFQSFVIWKTGGAWPGVSDKKALSERTAFYVRQWCNVNSRSELIAGTPVGNAWEKLTAEYEVWRTS